MKKTVMCELPPRLSVALTAALAATALHAQAPSTGAAITKGVASSRAVAQTTQGMATSASRGDSRTEFNSVGPVLDLVIGKSTLMRLPSPVTRISLGNPTVADVTLISPTELYLLGKTYGSTNLIIWNNTGAVTAIDVNVNIDYARMERKLRELLPDERGIQVRPAADSVILTGTVSSALKAKYAEDIANAFVRDVNRSLVLPIEAGDAKVKVGTKLQVSQTQGQGGASSSARVVNLLQIAEAQQVMLEVVIAEVSKTLLDRHTDKRGQGLT